ncbi:C45 family peptidase [Microbacterium sp. WCS2018Hpa-9]|uniref:C45 family peptidase n=1 Tax=Microbacterium sp. WCS2018Hpa-9 TaxID=3073635 RepID=UPI00288C2224|nr:C45 family peptidase [Microbacterium sp. WCS2018Hpa-9]
MTREHLEVSGGPSYARGSSRGLALSTRLGDVVGGYLSLFAIGGLDTDRVRELASRIEKNTAQWDSRYVDEMHGIAAGAGIPAWQVIALNGRTEIISQSTAMSPAECSVLVRERGARGPVGIQTWDWQDEFSSFWHTQTVHGSARSFVGLTEHGILAKIGVNDAGLGVFLNILSSASDEVSGVPVHLLLAAILETAATVSDAIDLLRSAPIASSSAITLIDPHRAVTVELSPVGIAVIEMGAQRHLAHTNHFLSDGLVSGENPGSFGDDTYARLQLIDERADETESPFSPSELVPLLLSGPGEPHLCCVPESDARFGLRWRTLATATIDPLGPLISILDGAPAVAGDLPWRDLFPRRPQAISR